MYDMVNINGNILEKSKAQISVFDHGFLFGDSVYEVLITWKGRLFTVKEHLDRLTRSAKGIYLHTPWEYVKIKKEIIRTIAAAGYRESYIRIILTRGVGEVNIDPSSCSLQNIIIIVNEFKGYAKEYYEKGIHIAIVPILRNHKKSINPAMKTGNYLNSVLAIIEAKKRGAYDGLMLNIDNIITECTTSNFYIVVNGTIKTSSCESGILEGITRGLVLNIARESNIPAAETAIPAEEIFKADEAFVTSTTKGVMPVTICDNKKIGSGSVGPITGKLIRLYEQKLEEISEQM